MKVLGIAGSPRKEGNSAFLLRKALQDLAVRFETETVFLSGQDIRPCEACHDCEKSGQCRIEDDMPEMCRKLEEADAIILSTGSQMGGVTSRMRAFMERTWPLRKGQMARKVGTYIVTGRRRIGLVPAVLEDYLSRLGVMKIPGALGYAFDKGQIANDREALRETERLAADIRYCLTPPAGGESDG